MIDGRRPELSAPSRSGTPRSVDTPHVPGSADRAGPALSCQPFFVARDDTIAGWRYSPAATRRPFKRGSSPSSSRWRLGESPRLRRRGDSRADRALPEDGQVAVLDPGIEVVLRVGNAFRFDDAVDAAVQAEKEAASVILVVSGTVDVTHHGSELARFAAGQGVLWRGEELAHIASVGGPVVYYQAEGRLLRREHFDVET